MGGLEENWFYKQLSYSSERKAVWKVVGQQIVFNRLNETYPGNSDYIMDYVWSLE
jgi:alkaline phosphatase D